MRIGILGPLEVVGGDGTRRDPSAARQRRLLLALLVWRGEPVSIDRLVDIVWSGAELPRDPVATLRTYVTRLRTVLDPDHVGGQAHFLVGAGDHYRLELDGHDLDATRFEEDLARGHDARPRDPAEALRFLDRALMRWRGPALMEVADEHWALPEAVRLEELRLHAIEERFQCLLDTGAHLETLGALERHVREHPLRERPHGLLMLALDRAGRTADALEVFRSFRRRLADETGLDPSADLARLHDRLLGHSDAEVFGAAAAGVWNELPPTTSPLVGRDRELRAVRDLIGRAGLVTVTGTGGVGKTRLALEIAHVDRDTGTSVLFVELATVTASDDVADAVFSALRLPAAGRTDAVAGLVRVLRARPGLVVLDNCEHVLASVCELVERLLRDCPELTLLTTSREPLGIEGERVYRLPSLEVADSVALFRERATSVASLATDDPADDAVMELICRRLDGIPLAIELAAVRTGHLSVAEIADRLDERFWLLTGGRRALPRQQTIAATIDWSYDLLDADEQRLFRAASVFVGGFDVAALAAVAQVSDHAAVDVLASLVAKSLVEATVGREHARYRLSETVRLYGLERVRDRGDLASLRQRHAEHYLGRAVAVPPRLADLPAGGGERTMCRIRLQPMVEGDDPDLANQLEALAWLDRCGDLVGCGRLAARMATVLDQRGFLDPDRRYLRRADVADALANPEERALYLVASALQAPYFGSWAEELRFGEAAMASTSDPQMSAVAAALTTQACLAFDLDRVPELAETALRDLSPEAHHARLLLRGQQTLHLVMKGHLVEAVERLEAHARAGDVFAAGELRVLLHVVDDDDRVETVAIPEAAEAEHVALWSYRWPLTEGLVAAARGRHAAAAAALVRAGEIIATSPVSLLDRDLLMACAVATHHAGGDAVHALHLTTVAEGRWRSPASRVLYRHYAPRIRAAVSDGQLEAVVAVASELRPAEVLEQELARLRMVVEDARRRPEQAPTTPGARSPR
ncbi:MAG: AAA family ATPase [Actinobacteria bacterium]|nr:AAA family ATPase [Actinomycetota bacterium]